MLCSKDSMLPDEWAVVLSETIENGSFRFSISIFVNFVALKDYDLTAT